MLQKCPKPGYKDWRPIAVGSIINKVVCGFYRENIEDHLILNNLNHEIQYGFTKGGRVDHCIFTLNHITNMTYESRRKEHKNLYFAMIDFKKAYESMDRWNLIEVMRKYNIHTDIIDIMVQNMYSGDTTTKK